MTVLGIVGAGAITFDVTLWTSNDGINWIQSAAAWPLPINIIGTHTLSPTDLGAFFRFNFLLNGGGVQGNITAVTYGLFVNLKDT